MPCRIVLSKVRGHFENALNQQGHCRVTSIKIKKLGESFMTREFNGSFPCTATFLDGARITIHPFRGNFNTLFVWIENSHIYRVELITAIFYAFLSSNDIIFAYETASHFPSRCRRYERSPDPGTALRTCHGVTRNVEYSVPNLEQVRDFLLFFIFLLSAFICLV